MYENPYKTEYNDKGINVNNLNKTFNVSNNQIEKYTDIDKELTLTTEIDEEKIPDNILHKNIEKANTILDAVIDQVSQGNMSGMMIQAAAKLIDSITTATSSLLGVNTQEQELEYKQKLLDLKEKDLIVKLIVAKQKKGENVDTMINNITNNNVIVASREEILKMLDSNGNNTELVFQEK